jgi:GalNAc-alpha-(1->4)-GalNAc-alpha-(1->3)-diNAcBac-PP-undecaprenol alpha-1,4-N-acetyl-D-galactosaminyltransferase
VGSDIEPLNEEPKNANYDRKTFRLTFLIYKMSGGGAQRVLSIIANYFAEKNWAITLLTYDDGSNPSFFKLHPSVQCQPLSIMRNQGGLLKALRMHLLRPFVLRAAIKNSKPDAVIAFIDLNNILTLVATLGLSTPIIISERVDPAQYSLGMFWSTLRKWIYCCASRLVVQTQDALDYFSPIIQRHSEVIPNPIIPIFDLEQSPKPKNQNKIILAMGRLVEQKGFDLLIQAFARIKPVFSDWELHIWGEGEQKKILESLRDELGLREHVRFRGMTQDNYNIMRQADIFVLSSRYEGFPNVLGEAMACGLPVISFDCPSGPSELITHGMNGLLIPKINAIDLASEMQCLMENETLAKRLGNEARKVTEIFSLNKVMTMWENLILEVITEESKNK